MKKAFQNSGSVVLALLVLFSTFSFTVDKHFCGSFLVDKAIFAEADTCGMDMENAADNCCTNEKVVVDGQDELKPSLESLDFGQKLFIASFSIFYFNLFETLPKEEVPFKDYSPPLLVTNIQLVDQVFLI
ncbi:HYC_CC_PP family protein [Salegentibacter sp. F14]